MGTRAGYTGSLGGAGVSLTASGRTLVWGAGPRYGGRDLGVGGGTLVWGAGPPCGGALDQAQLLPFSHQPSLT